MRRAVVQYVDGLDPTIDAGEDWEWMLRIARRYPVGLVDKPVVLFRQRPLGDAGYVDEVREWQNLRASLWILHRHLRGDHFLRRLNMQRFVWKRRGWYASRFMQLAVLRIRAGERNQALRCLYYGMRSSPVHTVLLLTRAVCGYC